MEFFEMLIKTANEETVSREEALSSGFSEAQLTKMDVGAAYMAQKFAAELVSGSKTDPNLHGKTPGVARQEAGGAVATDESAKKQINSLIEKALDESFDQVELESLGGKPEGQTIVKNKQLGDNEGGRPASKEASWDDIDSILGL